MAKYKPYDYNQLIMIPVSLEAQLIPGTLEHTIHMVVENEIDISIFDEKYNNDETGCKAYNPKILLKSILLGYARGKIGSRKIEQACRENIIFMALTCGKTPDHSTIAAFVTSMGEETLFIFQKVLLICDRLGLLGGTCFAVDGCKLPGNASKEWSGTFDELQKKQEKLKERLSEMLQEHIVTDQKEYSNEKQEKKADDLKKQIEKIETFLKENEPKPGKKKKENKSNITDNDSHLMRTSHGVIQGYNAQAMVDSEHQIIVHADAGDSGQDDEHLPMMIEGLKENLKAIGKSEKVLQEAVILGDANYNSPTNLTTCVKDDLNAYFPDKNFRKTDPRQKQTNNRFSMNDFIFNEKEDNYTCPAQKTLIRKSDIKRNGQKYYRSYVAQELDCQACSYRKRCLTKKQSKRRYLSVMYAKEVAEYAQNMNAKFNTVEGRKIYDQRIVIDEPVFANLRIQKRLDKFVLRGKNKVNIQWILYCIVHNLEKLANNGYQRACLNVA